VSARLLNLSQTWCGKREYYYIDLRFYVMTFLQCRGHISCCWSVNANELGSESTPWLSAISCYSIQRYAILKNVKIRNTNIPATHAEALGCDGGEGILLGDNTGSGADMLRPIRFRCVGIWIPTELRCLLVYSWPTIPFLYSVPTCIRTAGTKMLDKSGCVYMLKETVVV
jgi:hypothetical protein